MGKLQALMSIASHIASLTATVGAIQMEKAIGASSVFYLAGTLLILVAVLESIGLKDVYKLQQRNEAERLKLLATGDQSADMNVEEQYKPTTGKLLKIAFAHMLAEKSVILAYFSCFSTIMMLTATNQFGILIFKQLYGKD